MFDTMCKRQKGESKVMVFDRSKSEEVDFEYQYRLEVECPEENEIWLNGERLETE